MTRLHTLPTALHARQPNVTPQRSALAAYDGQRVTGTAWFGGASRQILKTMPLYCLREINIYPAGDTERLYYSHLWTALDAREFGKLHRGCLFGYSARVARYRRRDNSLNWGLAGLAVTWVGEGQ